ncbi:hypothetical protein AN958_10065 [Leucoagaricus sp. SymC.cos]|nr:hypothetical protein AN958_10065 [Leucoagaricus sp. SymC.cos]
MGWTNSVPIFHEDVTYILRDEIPEYTLPYIDDVPIRGPASRYEHEDGTCEVIPANPGIRRFVWEHLNTVNRILARMKHAGGTFSGPKTTVIADQITIVGFESIPLDIIEATWLVKYPDRFISTTELVGLRAQALAKHAAHVEEMRTRISTEKIQRTIHLEEEIKHKIMSNEVKPGDLVLVKNSSIEKSADRKMKPRYLGPMVVIQRYRGGAFLLAELDGSINKVAAFRVVPYLAHTRIKFSARVQEALDATPEWLEKQRDADESLPGNSIEDLEEIHTVEASNESD